MTTLEMKKVWKDKDWMIHRHISGDLSHGFEVRPTSYSEGRGIVIGFGIPAKDMEDAKKVVKLAKKYGYEKAMKIWEKTYMKPDYHFGYVKGKLAKKYAPLAYGDYVEKLKEVI